MFQHVPTAAERANMFRQTTQVALKCCDRLAGALVDLPMPIMQLKMKMFNLEVRL